ncbi:VOC family protein [Spongiactinospora sp. 9N601]|uniref:VOC family protein n=1 Tax=Spongiactinospora sp. 9N601 TaxID=3375149 RepID=UPI003790F4EA
MLRGFTTINYWADDMDAARQWYQELLGVEPYFVRPVEGPPAYIEFRIGDSQAELGLLDRRYGPPGASREPGGVVMYWHVDDIEATLAKLLEMGAKEYQPITTWESGFATASVLDPFGNVLGIMYNPHYLEMLEGRSAVR